MIQISENASKKISMLKAEDNKPADSFLRVEVKKVAVQVYLIKWILIIA